MELRELGSQTTLMRQVEHLVTWVAHLIFLLKLNIELAPEVMCKQNHGVAVDYYALGVLAYECMLGQVIHDIVRFC